MELRYVLSILPIRCGFGSFKAAKAGECCAFSGLISDESVWLAIRLTYLEISYISQRLHRMVKTYRTRMPKRKEKSNKRFTVNEPFLDVRAVMDWVISTPETGSCCAPSQGQCSIKEELSLRL